MPSEGEAHCFGCFAAPRATGPCSHCNFDESRRQFPLALRVGTVLQGQYVLGRVLGRPGGSGITYLGYYLQLETRVAIKEYLPRDLAGRDEGQTRVRPHSDDDHHAFQAGLKHFLTEARTLARLNHDNVVRVRAYFEEHGTAYLVMDYYEGMSLLEYATVNGGRIPEQLAVNLMLPVLDGLAEVHNQGFLHRDVKPANIYLTSTGKSILLDFGAAKQAASDRTGTLSFLTPGFAPWEQYKQGGVRSPATDVYACGATLYYLISGAMPDDAPHRMVADRLQPLKERVPGVSDLVSDAVEWAMSLQETDRPQSVGAMQDALLGVVTSSPRGPGEQRPEVIAVRPQSVEFTALKETRRVTARVLAAAGRVIDGAPITWRSLDPTTVSVDTKGAVTSLRPGKATIEARSGDLVGQAVAEVAQVPARILLSEEMLTLRTGLTMDVSARVVDYNDQPVADAKIEWESADTSVATVDAAGRLTARNVGTTEIRARSGDISAVAQLVVTARNRYRAYAIVAAGLGLIAFVAAIAIPDAPTPVDAAVQAPVDATPSGLPEPPPPPRDNPVNQGPSIPTDAYVRIAGTLPRDARISVNGQRARSVRSGDSIAVQPDRRHVLRITAAGYDTARTEVRLAADSVMTWWATLSSASELPTTPRAQATDVPTVATRTDTSIVPAQDLAPAPVVNPPAPDSARRPVTDTAEPKPVLRNVGPGDVAAVDSVIRGFLQASTTRNAERLRSFWPGLTADAVARWETFWSGKTDIQVDAIDRGATDWRVVQHQVVLDRTRVTFSYRSSSAPGLVSITSDFLEITLQRDDYGKWSIHSMK
jgi:serine/threonine protein kinase